MSGEAHLSSSELATPFILGVDLPEPDLEGVGECEFLKEKGDLDRFFLEVFEVCSMAGGNGAEYNSKQVPTKANKHRLQNSATRYYF